MVLGAGAGALGGAIIGLPSRSKLLKNEDVKKAFDDKERLDKKHLQAGDEFMDYLDEKGYKYSSIAMSGMYK